MGQEQICQRVGLEGNVREDKWEGTLVFCRLHPQMFLSLFFGFLQSLVLSLPYPRVMSDTKQQLLPVEGLGEAGQNSHHCHQPSITLPQEERGSVGKKLLSSPEIRKREEGCGNVEPSRALSILKVCSAVSKKGETES